MNKKDTDTDTLSFGIYDSVTLALVQRFPNAVAWTPGVHKRFLERYKTYKRGE